MAEFTTEEAYTHRLRSRLAADYAARGWYVLPTWGRVPIKGLTNWEQQATGDPDEARGAWGQKGEWAGCNIAIACGPSGIVVIDLDQKNGKDGAGALAALLQELGIELPDTYTVLTPSGGKHLYFVAPRGVEIRLSQSQLADGVDIRAWGGLVVAAGSKIGDRPYQLAEDRELAELPPALVERLLSLSDTKRQKAGKVPDVIPQGERETQLVSMAGTMRRRGMSEDAIYAAIDIENSARCVPPVPEEDLRRIAGSVGRYEPAGEVPDEIEVDQDLLARTLVNLETARVANEMMKARATARQRAVLGGMMEPVNVLDFISAGPDPTEVCIWGVPEKGGVMGWAANQGIIVAGPPGTGKSTIALQVLLRRVGILEGTVLGMPVEVEKEPFCYLALDRADQIRQSVARMISQTDTNREAIERLLMIDNMPPTVDLRQPETFIAWLQAMGAKGVAMDSAKDLGFDLNDSGEGQAFNYLVQATLRSGIQIFVTHHSRKVPRGDRKPLTLNDLHGSQWVAAGAGSVLMLDGEAGPSAKRLAHVKPLTVPMAPLNLTLNVETGEIEYEDAPDVDSASTPADRASELQERILALLALEGEPMTGEAMARELGVHSGSVSRACHKLQDQGLIERGKGGWALEGTLT